MTVRVRIAPAPSGSLHVGNARTFLFNWLFARGRGGVLVLRVEDTDRKRFTEEAYRAVLEDLRWLGLDWAEGPGVGGPHAPYRQSERLGLHREAALRLVASGAAYHCYCTPEELEARRREAMGAGRRPQYDGRCSRLTDAERAAFEAEGRPRAVRFRVPEEGTTSFTDLVVGEIAVDNDDIEDFVILRSDGSPLYQLGVVADDGLMEITHVIRGDDHISNTPKQILLHRALGNPVPAFAHVPQVLGPDGRPLSKRHGSTSVADFRESGHLPDALVNYLALLGWGTADETILSRQELVSRFSIEDVHPSPARFDLQKLEWMNGEYVRALGDGELARLIEPFFVRDGLVADPPSDAERGLVAAAAPLVKVRIRRLEEAPGLVRSMFAEVEPDPPAVEKALRRPYASELLERASSALADVEPWDAERIGAALKGVQAEMGLGRKAFQTLYVAITGSATAAPLFDLMAIVGRERCLARLERARKLAGEA